ncbi:hypothetical protein A1Q1_00175 [Trichosporon asahii var. asahii CBS 2479]|uniref:Uncharacterized protein n=1 Tax=Trichosporon asahii var. asahii (strain ATCC 90039 / CBS 2479 / JCM 2466 / KCTC 7840 / NBRC 103889/ NCYC 2677 / UAMH 7654) TaxID=1186058 RepID=J6F0S0_TRIAS|nr:hypothetical protein A1Q1_00175 [Trichosporon asahii var. asahii CBS 2479]EJT50509.1 hypothetical protein A1Q1_00175 [Trichosporon asahii var. asahii CBS 2479]
MTDGITHGQTGTGVHAVERKDANLDALQAGFTLADDLARHQVHTLLEVRKTAVVSYETATPSSQFLLPRHSNDSLFPTSRKSRHQKDALWALAWTSSLISGGADGIVRFHDPADLTQALDELPALPLAISSISAAGDRALATSLDGSAALIDVEEKKFIDRVETGRVPPKAGENGEWLLQASSPPLTAELAAYRGALAPDAGSWAWTGRGARVAIRPVGEGEGALGGEGSVVDLGKGRFGMSVVYSPDGKQLAIGMETGHVHVVDVATTSVIATYTAHAMAVRALSWSPDSQWLYSGSDDARIVLHDVRAGAESGASGEGAVAILQGHQGWVLEARAHSVPEVTSEISEAFFQVGKIADDSGADSAVKLWDVGERRAVWNGSADGDVWGFAWQPEVEGALAPGKQFAVAGGDKKISLYRAAGAV